LSRITRRSALVNAFFCAIVVQFINVTIKKTRYLFLMSFSFVGHRAFDGQRVATGQMLPPATLVSTSNNA
jgi:hypothetical protein